MFVFISLFIPFTVFGMCAYLFSDIGVELNLSKKTVRTLYRVDIYTIDNLTLKAEWELLRLPDFGKTLLNEVKTALAEKGLSLSASSISFNPSASVYSSG